MTIKTAVAAFALVACGFSRPASAQAPPDLDPRIVALVGQVSEARLVVLLKKLEGFGTRNTLSSVDSPTRGIGAARQWIFDEMKGYSPRLQVAFETYRIAKQGRITRASSIVSDVPLPSSLTPAAGLSFGAFGSSGCTMTMPSRPRVPALLPLCPPVMATVS